MYTIINMPNVLNKLDKMPKFLYMVQAMKYLVYNKP